MITAAVNKISSNEYLALEKCSEMKHEFFKGNLIDMPGGSRTHYYLSGKLFSKIFSFLEANNNESCVAYNSDQRILVAADGNYFYPDISVICGDNPFVEEDVANDALLIVEVLSDSTEGYNIPTQKWFASQIGCKDTSLRPLHSQTTFVEV
jgi:Uma2 family endonuclease